MSRLIWSLYFGNSQFSSCHFQLAFNLVPTVNSLTENAYVVDSVCTIDILNIKILNKMLMCLNFSG